MSDATRPPAAAPALELGPRDADRLRRAGLLPGGAFLDAVALLRDEAAWRRWAARMLLALAAAHLLSGIVFFFAYNWQDIPAFGKFAAIEAGILAAFAAAWGVGIDRWPGRALLFAAALLVGVLLAVFGQVYQTGADAYSLFVGWALLIAPWTLLALSPALWMLTLVVGHVGWYAYQVQVVGNDDLQPIAAAGLADLAIYLSWRYGARRRWADLDATWFGCVLLIAALGQLAFSAIAALFERVDDWGAISGSGMGFILSAVFLLACAGLMAAARRERDHLAFALSGFALACWLAFAQLRLIEPDDFGPAFLTMLIGAGIFIGYAALLRAEWSRTRHA